MPRNDHRLKKLDEAAGSFAATVLKPLVIAMMLILIVILAWPVITRPAAILQGVLDISQSIMSDQRDQATEDYEVDVTPGPTPDDCDATEIRAIGTGQRAHVGGC